MFDRRLPSIRNDDINGLQCQGGWFLREWCGFVFSNQLLIQGIPRWANLPGEFWLFKFICHCMFLLTVIPSSREHFLIPFALPGLLASVLIFIGGIQFKSINSTFWSRFGLYAGLFPGTPAWILTAPICLWCLSVIKQPSIQRAFRSQRRSGYAILADILEQNPGLKSSTAQRKAVEKKTRRTR